MRLDDISLYCWTAGYQIESIEAFAENAKVGVLYLDEPPFFYTSKIDFSENPATSASAISPLTCLIYRVMCGAESKIQATVRHFGNVLEQIDLNQAAIENSALIFLDTIKNLIFHRQQPSFKIKKELTQLILNQCRNRSNNVFDEYAIECDKVFIRMNNDEDCFYFDRKYKYTRVNCFSSFDKDNGERQKIIKVFDKLVGLPVLGSRQHGVDYAISSNVLMNILSMIPDIFKLQTLTRSDRLKSGIPRFFKEQMIGKIVVQKKDQDPFLKYVFMNTNKQVNQNFCTVLGQEPDEDSAVPFPHGITFYREWNRDLECVIRWNDHIKKLGSFIRENLDLLASIERWYALWYEEGKDNLAILDPYVLEGIRTAVGLVPRLRRDAKKYKLVYAMTPQPIEINTLYLNYLAGRLLSCEASHDDDLAESIELENEGLIEKIIYGYVEDIGKYNKKRFSEKPSVSIEPSTIQVYQKSGVWKIVIYHSEGKLYEKFHAPCMPVAQSSDTVTNTTSPRLSTTQSVNIVNNTEGTPLLSFGRKNNSAPSDFFTESFMGMIKSRFDKIKKPVMLINIKGKKIKRKESVGGDIQHDDFVKIKINSLGYIHSFCIEEEVFKNIILDYSVPSPLLKTNFIFMGCHEAPSLLTTLTAESEILGETISSEFSSSCEFLFRRLQDKFFCVFNTLASKSARIAAAESPIMQEKIFRILDARMEITRVRMRPSSRWLDERIQYRSAGTGHLALCIKDKDPAAERYIYISLYPEKNTAYVKLKSKEDDRRNYSSYRRLSLQQFNLDMEKLVASIDRIQVGVSEKTVKYSSMAEFCRQWNWLASVTNSTWVLKRVNCATVVTYPLYVAGLENDLLFAEKFGSLSSVVLSLCGSSAAVALFFANLFGLVTANYIVSSCSDEYGVHVAGFAVQIFLIPLISASLVQSLDYIFYQSSHLGHDKLKMLLMVAVSLPFMIKNVLTFQYLGSSDIFESRGGCHLEAEESLAVYGNEWIKAYACDVLPYNALCLLLGIISTPVILFVHNIYRFYFHVQDHASQAKEETNGHLLTPINFFDELLKIEEAKKILTSRERRALITKPPILNFLRFAFSIACYQAATWGDPAWLVAVIPIVGLIFCFFTHVFFIGSLDAVVSARENKEKSAYVLKHDIGVAKLFLTDILTVTLASVPMFLMHLNYIDMHPMLAFDLIPIMMCFGNAASAWTLPHCASDCMQNFHCSGYQPSIDRVYRPYPGIYNVLAFLIGGVLMMMGVLLFEQNICSDRELHKHIAIAVAFFMGGVFGVFIDRQCRVIELIEQGGLFVYGKVPGCSPFTCEKIRGCGLFMYEKARECCHPTAYDPVNEGPLVDFAVTL